MSTRESHASFIISPCQSKNEALFIHVPVCTSTGSSAGLGVPAPLPQSSMVFAQIPPLAIWATMDAVPTLKGSGQTPERTGALWHWLILHVGIK